MTAVMLLGAQALATGPGGWDHVGDGGKAGTPSLNGAVSALNTDHAGVLYVGGSFTDAGGDPSADRIATWTGSAWGAVSSATSQIANGAVNAIAYDAATGHVFAGGTFTDAGGDPNADFLAVWNGTSWAPFCNANTARPITATVTALQIIGRTLYVAGGFAKGAGIASGDRLIACDLDTAVASSTIATGKQEFQGNGPSALAADSNGTLYAGGGFTDLEGIPAADNVAFNRFDGTGWHAMGSGGGSCSCAVDSFVRSLTAVGTDVYVGTDAKDVAGIPEADNVARWDGSAWHAVGSNTAGTDGWFPTPTTIDGLTIDGTDIYAIGQFQNANGDPTADVIAKFDGSSWQPIGSDGAGNGPLNGHGLAVAFFDQRPYAGGAFTSAGGDPKASYLAAHPSGPQNGRSVGGAPVSGVVLFKPPGSKTFVPLVAGAAIPVGSTIDATKGKIRLTAAKAKGGTETSDFSAGAFVIRQRPGSSVADLKLTGGAFGVCGARSAGSGPLASAARRHRRVRDLVGNGHGSFRTRGRYAAATVRGTIWETEDDCDGTNITVRRGVVAVLDVVRHKTVAVRAGHSYFAAAPRHR